MSDDVVLIFRLGSVGDTIVALPSFRLIKKAFPTSKRYILTNRPVNNKACALELVLENTGLVDHVIEYPSKISLWKKCILMRRMIRQHRFTTLIYMHQNRSLLNAWRDFLFFKCCCIQKIIGLSLFTHGFQYQHDPQTGLDEAEYKRLGRQLKALGEINWSDPMNFNLALTDQEIQSVQMHIPNRPFIVCSIGTKMAMNDWGQENWHALLSMLSDCYSQDTGIIFIGVTDEFTRSEQLLKNWQGESTNLCGKLSIRESAALLSFAQLFIGHDSGPMHLAAAVNTPCVAIFSRHNKPGWWYPFGTQHKNIYPKGKSILDNSVDEVAQAVIVALSAARNPSTVCGNPQVEII